MGKKNVAELLLETLAAQGVKRIYGVCGDSLNGITESIRSSKLLDWVHVRHEETAAFAAGAEAHLTGKLTVCAGSCGPGNMHLINGLYDCHRSRVPVLAIAAQIPTSEIGSNYFQETHPEHLFGQCSHYIGVVSHAEQMPRVLEIAMREAISKRGVSVIVLSGDIALSEIEAGKARGAFHEPRSSVTPSENDLISLARLLDSGKKVTILAGAGCADAHDELIMLAQRLQAPIVHALRGEECIEYDNPFDVGMTGLLGFTSGYRAIKECDVLLMVGTDFPYQQFYPEKAKIAQIDIRGEQLGRRCKLDLGVVGDTKSTILALLPRLDIGRDDHHLRSCVEHYRGARKELDELAMESGNPEIIHPQFVAKSINDLASDNAIFTCDVGTPTVWAARYLHMNGLRRLIGSFVHGSMASALPQAIGAQISHPGRQVIAMCGDGGLAMSLSDLLSLQQLDLPVKLIVFKNDSLAFVELEMKAAGILDFATDLVNPDFARLADASGILGLKAEDREQVRPMIAEALAHNGPVLVEIPVARQELSIPPTITLEQATGMGVFMMKAVLSGRGDEVLDLAKTNLLR